MAELTVTIDGTEHTVDQSAIKLPEGVAIYSQEALKQTYVPRSELDSSYVHKDEVTRRFSGWVKKEDAAKDDSIVSKVLQAHGSQKIDLEAAKKQWADEELVPVAKERDTLKSRALGSAINAAAAAAKFDERFTKRPDPTKPSYMETVLAGQFEYDAQSGEFVAVQDGNRITAMEPKNGHPWAGPDEWLARLAKQDGWKQYLAPEPTHTRGTGHGERTPPNASAAQSGGGGKQPYPDGDAIAAYLDKNGREATQQWLTTFRQ